MLINLSNHPSAKWESAQQEAAIQYGKIKDILFPNIPPEWDTDEVEILAKEYLMKIKFLKENIHENLVVHLSGEIIFCFLLAQLLLNENILVITSTTERIAEEKNGEKRSVFQFKKFRQYKII